MSLAINIYLTLVAVCGAILAVLGLFAYIGHKRGQRLPKVPRWRVWDDELGELSHTERFMMRGNDSVDKHFTEISTALLKQPLGIIPVQRDGSES